MATARRGDFSRGLAAHRKFDQLRGELVINPVKVGFAAHYAEAGRVRLVEEAPKEWKMVSISGTDLRATPGDRASADREVPRGVITCRGVTHTRRARRDGR